MNINNYLGGFKKDLSAKRKVTPETRSVHSIGNHSDSVEVKNYMRAYRKEVELPIFYETSIFTSKTPQRCLTHNNVLTLFCNQDQKPLCVNCIQSTPHKNHEVIPISKAAITLNILLKTSLEKIESIIMPNFEELIQKSQSNLQRVEKEMGSFVISITKVYNDLSAFIISKKKEHLKYYQHLWNKFRKEYSSIASQLSKANQFFKEKIQEVIQRNSEEHLLYNFNIISHLSKVENLLPSLGEYHHVSVKNVENKMNQSAKIIYQLLNFDHKIVPQNQTIERSSSLNKIGSKGFFLKNKQENQRQNELSLKNLHFPTKNFPVLFPKDPAKSSITPRQCLKSPTSSKHQPIKTKYNLNSPTRPLLDKNEKLKMWMSKKRARNEEGFQISALKSF